MKITEFIGRQGKVKIIVLNLDGSIKEVIELENKITDVGLNMQRDALKGAVTDLEIKYLGIGSSSTPPAAGDTALGGEFFRKQITKQEDGAVGVLVSTTYIAPYEANTPKIEELGWFAGVNATATKDSGILVARVLYSRQKTSLESLQIERTDTISEVV